MSLKCVHGSAVATDGMGCARCGGPAVLPEPDPEAAAAETSPQQYDEPGTDPRDTPWWMR
jgi:hypothetical protein